MSTLAPEQTAAATQPGDDLTHTVCDCSPDIALCGTDVTNEPWADGSEEATCVVCRDLEDQGCPKCSR
ncbi:hypothetical protein ACFOOM_12385 [Streptomyces echinoruber]|uniref:Uncharacterized protein n=1 Tax=Streptomyces echinoruber TaxID=68898 RepID=A0A918VJH7_9ACTN|nr:hypothetical protein [Streptomyces echinoruber]GHA01131.1 hypothetical protein GCM10010389_45570 [Streptomyces echinoruber]